MIQGWAARYIGLEYEDRGRGPKHDCWSLVRTIYQEQFGIALPSYAEDYPTATDAEEIGQLVRREIRTAWQGVPLSEAKLGDVLIFRMKGQPCHCAMVLDPPWFIHVYPGINTVLERWDSLKWEKRIVEVLRHEASSRGLQAVRG